MSSRIIREPDSRLESGYPDIEITCDPEAGFRAATARAATRPGRRRAALAAALAASAALALALLPAPPPTPAPVGPAAAPAAEPETAELAPRAAPPLRIVRSEPPLPRPPAALPPIVTLATRNLPLAFIEERRERPEELRLAELTTARARMIDATMPLPLHRPDAAAIRLAALGPVPDLRPAHRPPPAAPRPPAAMADRPLPRPASAAPVVVAALAPEAAAAIHAAVAAPPARPEGLRIERPAAAAPKPAPERAARVEAPPPVRVVAGPVKAAAPARAAPAPKPARVVAAPAPQPVRVVAAPAPQKATRVQSQQPLRVASVPQAQPRRAASAATSRAAGFSRGNMSLIGVFGSASERHALVRLSNGKVERVGAGDRIQGVQVAAVGADSVRLTRGGKGDAAAPARLSEQGSARSRSTVIASSGFGRWAGVG